jgi:hypothetical protein
MGNTAKNIITLLGVVVIGVGGYWVYTQEATTNFAGSDTTMQNMLNRTQVFIERRQLLDAAQLDVSLFEDQRFRSLQSYTTPIVEQPVGRANPFEATEGDTAN